MRHAESAKSEKQLRLRVCCHPPEEISIVVVARFDFVTTFPLRPLGLSRRGRGKPFNRRTNVAVRFVLSQGSLSLSLSHCAGPPAPAHLPPPILLPPLRGRYVAV